ncbi:MAG TPA: YqaA family protein [Methylocella sp.]|jgi:membrane protein YqaA with SNARE-associated domain
MFQTLYRWTLSLAESQHAPLALGVVAFAESSFFPMPADAILIPMSLAKPKQAWVYALICTLASVAGGVFGYAIGALLYETVGKWLIDLYGYGARMDDVRTLYAKWGWLVIVIKGFTPIPYKIVTITSGLLAYSLPLFIVLSIFTRGGRYFLIAALLNRYGLQAQLLLDKYFGWFLGILLVAIVAGFWFAAHVI